MIRNLFVVEYDSEVHQPWKLCDSWGAEIRDRFQIEGSAEKYLMFDDSRLKQAQLYEWGLRTQCQSTSFGNFTGKYFLLEPVGWIEVTLNASSREEPILGPRFAKKSKRTKISQNFTEPNSGSRYPALRKRTNQERGICMPDSCSIEEVLLLT